MMRRILFTVLALVLLAAVFGPYTYLERHGGREAIIVLTGMRTDDVALGASTFVAWVWMVVASVPVLVGLLTFGLTGRLRHAPVD